MLISSGLSNANSLSGVIRIKEGEEGEEEEEVVGGMEAGGQGEGGPIVGGCRLWVMTVCARSADSMDILHVSAHHDAHHDAHHSNGYE